MTAADTRVGDADVSGRSEGGVTTPLLTGDTHPLSLGKAICAPSDDIP